MASACVLQLVAGESFIDLKEHRRQHGQLLREKFRAPFSSLEFRPLARLPSYFAAARKCSYDLAQRCHLRSGRFSARYRPQQRSER